MPKAKSSTTREMSQLQFRKMIQIMKNKEINIDINKLQKMYKEKQKVELNQQKEEAKSERIKRQQQQRQLGVKLLSEQSLNQLPQLSDHGLSEDEDEQLLSYTFRNKDRIKNKFSQFNEQIQTNIAKDHREELADKIAMKIKSIQDKNSASLNNISLEQSTQQRKSLENSFENQLKEQFSNIENDGNLQSHQNDSILVQDCIQDLNKPINWQTLLKQKKTVRFSYLRKKLEKKAEVQSIDPEEVLQVVLEVEQQTPGRFIVTKIEPVKVDKQRQIQEIEDKNFFLTEGVQIEPITKSLTRSNASIASLTETIPEPIIHQDNQNDIFYEAFMQQLNTERAFGKQSFQFQKRPLPHLSFNDSTFFYLKKLLTKEHSLSPRSNYHYYEQPKDLYLTNKRDTKNTKLKMYRSQSNMNKESAVSQDGKKIKDIQKKIKKLIWNFQGSQGQDQSFLSISKSQMSQDRESIKQNYYTNKIQFPPLSERKMIKPEFITVEQVVPNNEKHTSRLFPMIQDPSIYKKTSVSYFSHKSQQKQAQTPVTHVEEEVQQTKIINVKKRVRKYQIEPLYTHLLQKDIPIVNYDPNILELKQYIIVKEEVETLQTQIYNLLSLYYIRQKYDFISLVKAMSQPQQVQVNLILEQIVAIVINIIKKLLNKFGETPDKIGMLDVNYILQLDQVVDDEVSTLQANMKLLRKVGQALYESQEAYVLMNTILMSDQVQIKAEKLNELIEWIVRARLYVVEVIQQAKLYEYKLGNDTEIEVMPTKTENKFHSILEQVGIGLKSQVNQNTKMNQKMKQLPNETRELIKSKSAKIIPVMENAKSQKAKLIQLTMLDSEKRGEDLKFLEKITSKKNQQQPKHQRQIYSALKVGSRICSDSVVQNLRRILNEDEDDKQ